MRTKRNLHDTISFDKCKEVGGLQFYITCEASPEQYDVYEPTPGGDYRQVGYVRLRYGRLTVDCPECERDSDQVLRAYFDIDKEHSGSFSTDSSRAFWLALAAERIKAFHKSEKGFGVSINTGFIIPFAEMQRYKAFKESVDERCES